MADYDPYAEPSTGVQRVRKLVASVISTGAALVVYLTTEDHDAAEVAASIAAFVTANYAVWRVPNDPELVAKR